MRRRCQSPTLNPNLEVWSDFETKWPILFEKIYRYSKDPQYLEPDLNDQKNGQGSRGFTNTTLVRVEVIGLDTVSKTFAYTTVSKPSRVRNTSFILR